MLSNCTIAPPINETEATKTPIITANADTDIAVPTSDVNNDILRIIDSPSYGWLEFLFSSCESSKYMKEQYEYEFEKIDFTGHDDYNKDIIERRR